MPRDRLRRERSSFVERLCAVSLVCVPGAPKAAADAAALGVNRKEGMKMTHASELRALPSRLTDTELVRIRRSGIRSAWSGQISTSG